MKSLRTGSLGEYAEDEQAWDNWLVESESDSSSDESDWINVESDGSNDLEISDSDNEMGGCNPDFARSDQHEQSSTRVSSLATTKVGKILRIPYEPQFNTSRRYLHQPILL